MHSHAHMLTHACTRAHACKRARTHTHTHTLTHTHTHTHTYTHAHTHTYTHTRTHTYTHTKTHTQTNKHTYTHISLSSQTCDLSVVAPLLAAGHIDGRVTIHRYTYDAGLPDASITQQSEVRCVCICERACCVESCCRSPQVNDYVHKCTYA
jgi:hypothetical protein